VKFQSKVMVESVGAPMEMVPGPPTVLMVGAPPNPTGVDVSWTPNTTSNYDLTVSAGGSVKTLTAVAGVSGTPQVDTVLGFTLEADNIANAKVTIAQQ